MRISDWSSDVCSSDLVLRVVHGAHRRHLLQCSKPFAIIHQEWDETGMVVVAVHHIRHHTCFRNPMQETMLKGHKLVALIGVPVGFVADRKSTRLNSRSLMRISYAVFCLQKKTSSQYTE